jgi:hypothetical protein
MWQRLSSGLVVPSTVAGEVIRPALELPPELMPPSRPVAVVDGLPGSEDQLWARPNERELGLTPSDLAYLIGEAEQIPFEPAMLAVARLAAANWHIPLDAEAQVTLAEGFFDGAPVVDLLRTWVRVEPRRVLFSEQQFFVVQRLLIDHARDGAINDGMTEAEFAPQAADHRRRDACRRQPCRARERGGDQRRVARLLHPEHGVSLTPQHVECVCTRLLAVRRAGA